MMNLFDVAIPDSLEYSVTRNKRGEPPRTYLLRLDDWPNDRHATQLITFEFSTDVVAPQAVLQSLIDEMVAALESHHLPETP